MPVLMLGSWVLNKIWITDLSSALVDMLISSSKFFLFFQQSSFKLLLELYCVIVIKHVVFFTIILYKITEQWHSIHIYQFTFELLQISFRTRVVVVSDLNKNIGGSTDLVT